MAKKKKYPGFRHPYRRECFIGSLYHQSLTTFRDYELHERSPVKQLAGVREYPSETLPTGRQAGDLKDKGHLRAPEDLRQWRISAPIKKQKT